MIKPLPGRYIIAPERERVSKGGIIIPDTYAPDRKLGTVGHVLAATPPHTCGDNVPDGARVVFHCPADRLAIEWEGQRAFAVHQDEILAVL